MTLIRASALTVLLTALPLPATLWAARALAAIMAADVLAVLDEVARSQRGNLLLYAQWILAHRDRRIGSLRW